MSISELPKKFHLNSQRLFPTIGPYGCPGKWRKKSSKMMKPAEIEVFPKAGFIAYRDIKGFPLFRCLRMAVKSRLGWELSVFL